MATNAEQLAEVQAAISAILAGGQSVRVGDRSVTMADLGELRAMQNELQAKVAAGTGRSKIYYALPG